MNLIINLVKRADHLISLVLMEIIQSIAVISGNIDIPLQIHGRHCRVLCIFRVPCICRIRRIFRILCVGRIPCVCCICRISRICRIPCTCILCGLCILRRIHRYGNRGLRLIRRIRRCCQYGLVRRCRDILPRCRTVPADQLFRAYAIEILKFHESGDHGFPQRVGIRIPG